MSEVDNLVERLNGTKKLRIWSVIITFFGDAIVPRGGSVSARTVQTLLEQMGIEAGAVRTAFSRLTNDGWVIREKIGRSSFYHLSPTGLQPFAEATDRIYATLPETANGGGQWQLTFSKEDYPKPQLKRVSSSCNEINGASDKFQFIGSITRVPDWLKVMNCLQAHRDSYLSLISAFEPLVGSQLSPIEALAVRCLLIHEWRRILFQYQKVEPEFWTEDWPEAECHQFVSVLYHQLLSASEDWMNKEATGPQGALPQPNSPLEHRFT